MITFIRSDDRLIHGQCQTKIIPMNGINRVIGVDDPTASNPMLKKIFEMAAPSGVKVTVHTFNDALTPISKCIVNDKKTLIIARRPSTLLKIYEKFPELKNVALDIANIPKEADTDVLVRRDCYVNATEAAAMNALDDLGVSVYFQQFPGDGGDVVYWKDVKNKF